LVLRLRATCNASEECFESLGMSCW
jgi:hypothetical protein